MSDNPTSPAALAMLDEVKRLRAVADLVEQTSRALIERYGEEMPEPDITVDTSETLLRFTWELSGGAGDITEFSLHFIHSADRDASYVQWECYWWPPMRSVVGEGLAEEAFAHLDAVIASMTKATKEGSR